MHHRQTVLRTFHTIVLHLVQDRIQQLWQRPQVAGGYDHHTLELVDAHLVQQARGPTRSLFWAPGGPRPVSSVADTRKIRLQQADSDMNGGQQNRQHLLTILIIQREQNHLLTILIIKRDQNHLLTISNIQRDQKHLLTILNIQRDQNHLLRLNNRLIKVKRAAVAAECTSASQRRS